MYALAYLVIFMIAVSIGNYFRLIYQYYFRSYGKQIDDLKKRIVNDITNAYGLKAGQEKALIDVFHPLSEKMLDYHRIRIVVDEQGEKVAQLISDYGNTGLAPHRGAQPWPMTDLDVEELWNLLQHNVPKKR